MPKPSALTLTLSSESTPSNPPLSPRSPRSPLSPPHSGSLYGDALNGENGRPKHNGSTSQISLPDSPDLPQSPNTKARKDSTTGRSFFSKPQQQKQSSQRQTPELSIRQVSDSTSQNSVSTANQSYLYRRGPGSTPDLSLKAENASVRSGTSSQVEGPEAITATPPITSSTSARTNTEAPGQKRASDKRRFGLSRTRSIRADDPQPSKPKPVTPKRLNTPEIRHGKHASDLNGLKTAPLEKDLSFREMMNSNMRNRSADRHVAQDSEEERHRGATREKSQGASLPSSLKDNHGGNLLNNIRNQGSKAADGLGKAGRGIFGKLTRSASSHEREPVHDEAWEFRVINKDLISQTRITRISKRLEDSRDKTEFWMPALPWRCIDYLNARGSEVEGLYRVPGSNKDVKAWQIRFDKEHDIDLFEESELYDINIIGSMFKSWLRDLPDEIFPKAIQARIQKECDGAKSTPQMLRDELSKLPPFNYYLLFAITCHISLLHAHSESNKMDYRNLCICFQPCMKIDAFIFQWLVLDWRNCWQGCWTEKEYLAKEMEFFKSQENGHYGGPSQSTANLHATADHSAAPRPTATRNGSDERAISSSGSSKPSTHESTTPDKSHKPSTSKQSLMPSDFHDEHATPTQSGKQRSRSELPELSPLAPLSPFSMEKIA